MYVKSPTRQSEHIEPILLVDDNPTNLQVLLQTLSGLGYKLLIAKNGQNALRIAHKAKPALVLLDIMMPGMDGYEVCRQLKSDSDTQNITVIFLSALDHTKDKVRGLEAGAVDFISKPFQAEEVIARVQTQLKIHRLEQALSARNRQLEADKARILESMNDGIFGLDNCGNITFVNAAASKMIGYPIDQLIGKSLMAVVSTNTSNDASEEPCHHNFAPIQVALSKGVSETVDDILLKNQDGTLFPVSYSCTPIMDADHPDGAVVVFTNISSKKRAQQALKKALSELETQKEKLTHVSRLSTMGEMAAGFAHEVNQPLTAISNYAQVAKRMMNQLESKNDDIHQSLYEAMDKINIQARRAGEIIARIRSFVKKPDHVLDKVDPFKLLSDTVKLSEVDARNNSMEIHTDLANNLPSVRVDPVQIQQVALNLLRNGMEAMRDSPNKGVGIMIKAEKTSDHFVKVSVTDRGYGLADDAEERLFTPFYTTKPDGMGIGLTVCHSIIQTHGGKLGFQRHPEGGTIFEFTMPIAD